MTAVREVGFYVYEKINGDWVNPSKSLILLNKIF